MAFRLLFQRFWLLISLLLCHLKWALSNEGRVAGQPHMPNDRPRHMRPHNLHRPPYNGYDWYNHYSRDEEPKKDEETVLDLDIAEDLAGNVMKLASKSHRRSVRDVVKI